MHEVELKSPPLPPSSQLTVPTGIVFVPLPESATVALNVIAFPIVVVAGLGATAVVVGRTVTGTVNDVVPKLPI